MDEIEAAEGDEEHQPAGELVEEPEGLVWVPILDAEAGAEDADDVGGDGDGEAGDGEEDTAPGISLEEVAVDDGDGEEGDAGSGCRSRLRLPQAAWREAE